MVIERSRQVLENPLGLLGGRTVPSLTQIVDGAKALSRAVRTLALR
jgi:hypothetical protein